MAVAGRAGRTRRCVRLHARVRMRACVRAGRGCRDVRGCAVHRVCGGGGGNACSIPQPCFPRSCRACVWWLLTHAVVLLPAPPPRFAVAVTSCTAIMSVLYGGLGAVGYW